MAAAPTPPSLTPVFAALVLTGAALSALALSTMRPAPSDRAEVDPMKAVRRAEAFYASRDPYERPRPYTPTPSGVAGMSAETCGACHQEIYQEWSVSTHRRAWLDDAQFQHELRKSRGEFTKPGEEKKDVGWLCINCHTPLINQQPRLVVGLEGGDISKPIYVDNPTFDETLQEDAITCAVCHVKDGVVYGPWGDGSKAPHPVAKGEELMTEQICASCHQAERIYEEQVLGCFFSTGREWRASPAGQAGQTCQTCHMPEVRRKVAEHFDVPVRKTRRHWFGGSLIPKKPEFEAEIAPLREVYGSGIDIALVAGGAPNELIVRMSNVHAGHHFPAGDPERHADVVALVKDAQTGEELAKESVRLGTKYTWWPKIELEWDTRIKAGEHTDMVVKLPGAAKREVSVEITADKWRMYPDAFEYHELEGEYVRGRRFHDSVWSVSADGTIALVRLDDDKH
ncbi:MAG: multiheme c-type cytochrome [Myxococcota bacterium]